MKEKNRAILKKAIGQLPEYSLKKPDIWIKIENRLNETDLDKYYLTLPVYKAPDNLWEKVEKELNKKRKLKQNYFFRLMIRISAAAVLILLVGYGILRWDRAKVKIEELQSNSKTEIFKMDNTDDSGIESIYNPALCQSNPQICSTDLFKSLDKELNDIKVEIEALKPMIKGNDPQIMKYYYRLVNERVEIEKRMVKIIMQT